MIQVTENAIEKVRQMIRSEGKSGLNLRLYVEGGGCSGLQYGLKFDEDVRQDDELIDCGDFKIVVDRMSLPFLEGAQDDFPGLVALFLEALEHRDRARLDEEGLFADLEFTEHERPVVVFPDFSRIAVLNAAVLSAAITVPSPFHLRFAVLHQRR